MNADIFLTYLIWMGWIKELHLNALVFDITQFFPSLNCLLLPIILTKASFDIKVSCFFSNYWINRQTQYVWNYFTSLFFNTKIRVEQGSAFSSILSTLYIAFFHIFEKRTKNLSILISVFFFFFIIIYFLFLRRKVIKNQILLYKKTSSSKFFFIFFG